MIISGIILAYLIGLGVAIRIIDLEQDLSDGDWGLTEIIVVLIYPIWIVPYCTYKISKKIIK